MKMLLTEKYSVDWLKFMAITLGEHIEAAAYKLPACYFT